jgi:hypothetical protein
VNVARSVLSRARAPADPWASGRVQFFPPIAVPQLLYPEPMPSSAFFLKKKAPFAESQRQVNCGTALRPRHHRAARASFNRVHLQLSRKNRRRARAESPGSASSPTGPAPQGTGRATFSPGLAFIRYSGISLRNALSGKCCVPTMRTAFSLPQRATPDEFPRQRTGRSASALAAFTHGRHGEKGPTHER